MAKNIPPLDELLDAWDGAEFSDALEFVEPPVRTMPRNLILTGPPGTGKTTRALQMALHLVDGTALDQPWSPDSAARFEALRQAEQLDLIVFHPAYGYADLVESIQPVLARRDGNEQGDLRYSLRVGVLKRLAKHAAYSSDNHVLVIDQIHRADLNAVFGDVALLLDPARRLGQPGETHVTLPVSQEQLALPSNFYLIATLDTAEGGAHSLPPALRRHFVYEAMPPCPEWLTDIACQGIALDKLLTALNDRINWLCGENWQIGPGWLLPLAEASDPFSTLGQIWEQQVLPWLWQACGSDGEKVEALVGAAFVAPVLAPPLLQVLSQAPATQWRGTPRTSWKPAHFKALYRK